MSMPIRIIDTDFRLIAELNLYHSLQITRKWHGVGDLTLHVNRHVQNADKLKKGNIIFPFDQLDKAYIIRHREIALDADGKASENWEIRALHLKSWLEQRITVPPVGFARDELDDAAETIMLNLIKNNAVTPTDAKRKINNLVLADDLKRGPQLNWGSRYKVLSEELEKIGAESKLGWNIRLDIKNKQYVVEVLEGIDRTYGQRERPPAVFSPEFQTLKSMNYLESDLDYKNVAYVAGQGEGIDRRIIDLGESTGIKRYETFVDARDVPEEINQEEGDPIPRPVVDIEKDLIARGNQRLAEHEQEIYLEGEALDSANLQYEVDWDLGDMVTIQNKEWNVTNNAQVTEVLEVYEEGIRRIEPLFGGDRPDLISTIKQELSGVEAETTK